MHRGGRVRRLPDQRHRLAAARRRQRAVPRVRINADGTGSYVDGNLGAAEPVTLSGQTYRALGWTIAVTPTGMRFTNDRTGRGAIVGTDRVQPF